MGRIKSKLIKRTAGILLSEENTFTDDFSYNKDMLKGIISSKKIRNQISGYISRKKKVKR